MATNLKEQAYATRLSEAIITQSTEEILECLKKLIISRVQIKTSIKARKFICDSHSSMFPNEPSRFNQNEVLWSSRCEWMHKFCRKCILAFVKNNFQQCLMDHSKYQCMYCAFHGITGSLMFDYNYLRMFAVEIFGEQYVSQLENYDPNRPKVNIQNLNQCGYCQRECGKLMNICLGGHQISQNCLKHFLINLEDRPLVCFSSTCNQGLYVQALISLLENDPFISKLKPKLEAFGFFLNFCPSCSRKVELTYGANNDQLETLCTCGVKICNNCKRIGHYGKTCFYFESSQDFEVIDLAPPKNIDRPENLKEQEYLNAKYAFENFLETPGSRFKGAKLIVNKALEDKYAEKKQKMALQCGGEDKINEIYIWHGSKFQFYDAIMKEGLKVGGVDGIPIGQGKVHGYGVYCSTTPDTPMSYANDSTFVLACLAMKGIESPNMANDPAELNTGKFHSYKPLGTTQKNWQVIFTKEQVLPRFLVEFTR
jgi:hypothetical protein